MKNLTDFLKTVEIGVDPHRRINVFPSMLLISLRTADHEQRETSAVHRLVVDIL